MFFFKYKTGKTGRMCMYIYIYICTYVSMYAVYRVRYKVSKRLCFYKSLFMRMAVFHMAEWLNAGLEILEMFWKRTTRYGGFHSHGGYPIVGWCTVEHPNLKWMILFSKFCLNIFHSIIWYVVHHGSWYHMIISPIVIWNICIYIYIYIV